MIKNALLLIAVLGLAIPCSSQSTLTTPVPGNTQCTGPDCPRQSPSNIPGSNPQGGQISPPYVQTAPYPGEGNPRYEPGAPGYPGYLSPDLFYGRRMPEYTRTEFEKFVQASVGRDLRLFGHEYFAEVPTTFAPVDRIPVRGDYVIGPGDELLIRAWGRIDIDARAVVDRNGQIYLPRVGAITVTGVRYDQLNPFLHAAVGRFYKDFDLNVAIGQLRSIQVFVLGYARRPGTYTVSSLSTLVNTLFASGGPASDGSMRHVQLKRNNAPVTDLDVYDLILKGDKSGDAPLESGDVIYIPHVGPLVAMVGSVNRPAIYELRQASASTLNDALENAGGLTSVAGAGRASLERIDSRSQRVFDEFALDDAGLRHQLKDGDVVRIYPVSPRISNAVTLRGNVAQPGRYLWHEGMRVADLIPSRDTLITREYWNAQNAIVPEGRGDEFSIRRRRGTVGINDGEPGPPSEREGQPRTNQEPGAGANQPPQGGAQEPGANRRGGANAAPGTGGEAGLSPGQPGYEDQDNQQELRTEVKHRGSAINWEYAVIERLNSKDLTTELIPFNLGAAIDQHASGENQALAPGDVVTIFSQEDVPVATENRAKFVQVSGEVKAPGVYRVAAGETLRDVVARAGGLASHAYLYGSELHRETARKEQRKRLAQMVQRMQRELSEAAATPAGLTADERAEEQLSLREQRDFIERLARVEPTGRVVLQLKPSDAQLADIPAMPLEDGDVFTVPAKGDTVSVLGSVYNENTFRFRPGEHVSAYVSSAGGPTRGADKGRMFVIRADGSVTTRQQQGGLFTANHFESMRLMPGDAIVVPQRIRTRSSLAAFRDWTQIFSQLALGAAAIAILQP
ncbi:MAG TPA: SLBB domain-containing protein [Candidatus Angelobacter sp.]|nr:SLBB domain-containing protein [Candidatus Angelobacter sp.]